MSKAVCFAARALAEEKAVLGGPRTISSGAIHSQQREFLVRSRAHLYSTFAKCGESLRGLVFCSIESTLLCALYQDLLFSDLVLER